MIDDPRRPIVEVMARLGRETQLHLDERHRHFQITDAVISIISLLLAILAIVNVYYVRVLYKDLDGIVTNMDSMYAHLRVVDKDMQVITDRFGRLDTHIQHMQPIEEHMRLLAEAMPYVRGNMHGITGNMLVIERDMGALSGAMATIDQRLFHINGAMSVMRENMRQISGPMGAMNPMFP